MPAYPRRQLRRILLLAIVPGTLALGACATRGDAPNGPTAVLITPALIDAQRQQQQRLKQDITPLTMAPPPYAIGAADILSIVVWGHPELASAVLNTPTPVLAGVEQATAAAPAQGFVVSDDGFIQFPYAGDVPVAGLSAAQARDLLAQRLAPMFNQPRVTLRVLAFRSQRIYVDGEVKAPGVQPINDVAMTLTEAINRAGGVTPAGDQSQLTLLRQGQRYRINLPALIQQGIDPSRITLRHGDILRVQPLDESKVFVSGEVVAPRALTMHNGRLSLNEAIGEAGGINPLTGDARRVFVVRRSGGTDELYQLDARDTGALAMAEAFELRPRDLVYIDATGLASWHRTLSLLIPGALTSAVSAGKQ
ncbi:capsular polysaccharide transporter [Duganella caerulea]|uniref:polysaccharide biosynthesis/export family protein n=1 Tax=Duganella caerulea TaxID=2885762 RepID=UPI0030EAFAA8